MILKRLFGNDRGRFAKNAQVTVEKINKLEPEFEKLSLEELRSKTGEFKKLLGEGELLDNIVPQAFALARESAKRTLGQRHYDVQLIGGLALHHGSVAEMRTGEGKTLSATLAVYANALSGKGVHVVTVNDYLARRDTVWMGQIYNALGLSVGCLNHDSAYVYDPSYKTKEEDEERDTLGSFRVVHEYLRPVSRKEAYRADITYGTNNEFGFDYLRDNLISVPEALVQRSDKEGGWNFAIVDEVDSILIDEARTPLIISQPDEESGKLYSKFANIVPKLEKNTDYEVDEKRRAVTLTQEGISHVETLLGIENLYADTDTRFIHHLDQALKAHVLFARDKDYIVKNDEVIIVDQFTGRLMPGRRYSEGLHQAIEAKEGVKVQRESRTVATITFQNYFRLYEKIAGMTGTAETSAEEFFKVYGLEVSVIPTHRPMVRRDFPDRVYRNEVGKFKAVALEVARIHATGQPVLVGTVSIEKNEFIGELLRRAGIPHKVLNAKNHEQEAETIAQAGRLGAVTVATNMAGRGVDIILGGNPEDPEQRKKVLELGGLCVIGTERHEARRIDNQLRGRAGRQGDPGSSIFFVSLEDDLMRVFGGEKIKSIMERLNVPEDEPIESGLVSRAIESAQEKIEGYHFDARKHVLDYDEVLSKHREAIYKTRREIILSDKTKDTVLEMVEQAIGEAVLRHTLQDGGINTEELLKDIGKIFTITPDEQKKLDLIGGEELKTKLANYAKEIYGAKEEKVGEKTMRMLERAVLLRVMDQHWMDHLEHMDYIKSSIGLRAIGQRDPLIEYTREGRIAFEDLQAAVRGEVSQLVYRVELVRPPESLATQNLTLHGAAKTSDQLGGVSESGGSLAPQTPKSESGEKIGRNDPCPCGSGKKYKKCGLLNTDEHQRLTVQK